MLISTDFWGAHFSPMRKIVGVYCIVYYTSSGFCPGNSGHILVKAGCRWSWVRAKAPRQWLVGHVSNQEAKSCFESSLLWHSRQGKPLLRPSNLACSWSTWNSESRCLSQLAFVSVHNLWMVVLLCLFQVGLKGVVKIGWADFPGMTGGGPSNFIIPNEICGNPGAL